MLKPVVAALVALSLLASAAPADAASRTVVIRGHVTSTAGEPLAGVAVRAEGASTVSDGVGEFEGDDVTDSSGSFSIRAFRWKYLTILSDSIDWADVKTADVKSGSKSSVTIDLVVAKAGSIDGTVTDAAAAPVKHVTVFAYSPSGTETASALTDAAGHFTLAGLGPDTYSVTTSRGGYLPSTASITILEGQTVGLTMIVTKSTKITGSVHVNGVEADLDLGLVTATLFNAVGARVETDRVTSGQFAFGKLTPGDFRLNICVVGECADWVDPATGSTTISVATGDSRRVDAQVAVSPAKGFKSVTRLTITPKIVKWGKKVKVVASVRSYGDVSTGYLRLQHHGRTADLRKIGSDGTVTFTVTSKAWGNKEATNRYTIHAKYAGAPGVRASQGERSFRIR